MTSPDLGGNAQGVADYGESGHIAEALPFDLDDLGIDLGADALSASIDAVVGLGALVAASGEDDELDIVVLWRSGARSGPRSGSLRARSEGRRFRGAPCSCDIADGCYVLPLPPETMLNRHQP
jgi:hypothetical protein